MVIPLYIKLVTTHVKVLRQRYDPKVRGCGIVRLSSHMEIIDPALIKAKIISKSNVRGPQWNGVVHVQPLILGTVVNLTFHEGLRAFTRPHTINK